MKTLKKLILLTLLFLPINIKAYSHEVILGGENIGINIESKGVLIIGFYEVNNKLLKGTPELMIGDTIIKVEDSEVNTIEELTTAIEEKIKNNKINITILRDDKQIPVQMFLEKVDNVYKTGLYVKDDITGIGTLTYIDPTTKIYGALGHEIIESKTSKLIEVKTGSIFESNVTSIRKSQNGQAGEKNANFKYQNIYGNIKENTNNGIFGFWQAKIKDQTIEIASNNEIELGNAKIVTVINGNKKEEYNINITSVQDYNDTKNITFEITDEKLLNKTGGIVQGMSGSPIIQNNKLIGAVTHVIVDNPVTGYGLFITKMLEEGEK